MRPSLRLLVPCAVLALAASASADTLKVPQDFATISAAAAVAQDGDTISVSKGTYLETVVISAPNVKLVGKKAVIDAQFGGTCIAVSADGVSIAGFTLVNGIDGVFGANPGLTVTKCVIATCSSRGMDIQAPSARITSNTITGCSSDGINFSSLPSGETLIDKNTCRLNGGFGIAVVGDSVQITRNRCERNEGDGINVFIDFPTLDGDAASMIIEKNVSTANEDDGIDLFGLTGALVVVHDNDASDNCDTGLNLNAPHLDVQGNHGDDNRDDGLTLVTDHSVVSGNSASGNQGSGMVITGLPPVADGTISTGDLNTVSKNTCNDNAGDGMRLEEGVSNTFTGNKCSGNGDDGLDIASTDCQQNVVDGNNFSNNGHEGLDNTGAGTDVTKNTCKGNGYGNGPDIAGTGDGGQGSVDAFQDNKFDTGGESVTSRLDNFQNTTP